MIKCLVYEPLKPNCPSKSTNDLLQYLDMSIQIRKLNNPSNVKEVDKMSFESPWPSVLSSRHWSMQRKYSLLAQKIQDKQIESERIYLLHLWGAGLRRLIRSRCTKRVMHTFTSSDKRPLTNLATIVRTLPSFIPWLFYKRCQV